MLFEPSSSFTTVCFPSGTECRRRAEPAEQLRTLIGCPAHCRLSAVPSSNLRYSAGDVASIISPSAALPLCLSSPSIGSLACDCNTCPLRFSGPQEEFPVNATMCHQLMNFTVLSSSSDVCHIVCLSYRMGNESTL